MEFGSWNINEGCVKLGRNRKNEANFCTVYDIEVCWATFSNKQLSWTSQIWLSVPYNSA